MRINEFGVARFPGAREAGGACPDFRGAEDCAGKFVIVTEWKEFRSPDFERIKGALKQPVVFDGRNLYEPEVPRSAGIEYVPIGRRSS